MEIYSCYAGVEDEDYLLFEELWHTYSGKLPKIESVFQDDIGVRTTVFNLWINYYRMDAIIFLKPESSMLNSNVEGIVNKLKGYIPGEIIDELEEQQQSPQFMFIYAYHTAKFICQYLDDFTSMHEFLGRYPIRRKNIYLLNDDDVEPSDVIYVILKILNFEFVQHYLAPNKCYELHFLAMYFTKSFLRQYHVVLQ